MLSCSCSGSGPFSARVVCSGFVSGSRLGAQPAVRLRRRLLRGGGHYADGLRQDRRTATEGPRAGTCCAVLSCAVLYFAVLCCAVLCCAVLCCAVLCCAVLRCAVMCCSALCGLDSTWRGAARRRCMCCDVLLCGVTFLSDPSVRAAMCCDVPALCCDLQRCTYDVVLWC